MTPDQLRCAGYPDEADCLEAAKRRSDAWRFDVADSPYRPLALGLFGSKRFNELAEACGVEEW